MITATIKLMLAVLCIAVVNSALEFMDFQPYLQLREAADQQLQTTLDSTDDDDTEQAGESQTEEETGTVEPEPITQPIGSENW